MKGQAKECQGSRQPPEAKKNRPLEPLREQGCADSLVSDFQAPERMLCLLEAPRPPPPAPVCGPSLGQPWETNTPLLPLDSSSPVGLCPPASF